MFPKICLASFFPIIVPWTTILTLTYLRLPVILWILVHLKQSAWLGAVKLHLKEYYLKHGIEPCPRAKGQQIAIVDRRIALLRDQLHLSLEQCKLEGITTEFLPLLTECNFACNAMLSVGGYSPYECVYGRTPGMLPAQPDNLHEEGLPRPGTIRHTHRLREIVMASVI